MPSHILEEEKINTGVDIGVDIGAEPYPSAADLDADSAHVHYRLNTHRHSFTCWKHNLRTCRICLPRLLAQDNYIAELSPDPAFNQQIMPLRN